MLLSRRVLADCKLALDRLEATESEDDFRLYYIAAVALVRSVGHVLDKVDGRNSPATRQAIDRAWRTWRELKDEHQVFWCFIDDERNLVLKEHALRYMSGTILLWSGESTYRLDKNLFRPLEDGPFADEDVRDVLSEAISWWECQLNAIEAEALNDENHSSSAGTPSPAPDTTETASL